MKKFLLLLVFGLSLIGCNIEFAKQQIFEDQGRLDVKALIESSAEQLDAFTTKSIYQDKITDEVWGVEKVNCKEVKLNSETVYEGSHSLQIEWNKGLDGCDWLGIGFGWDNWKGKNIGDIMFSSAIQMKIRKLKLSSKDLPTIVFLLEDYTETNVAVGLQSGFLERKKLDMEWQTLTVPLYLFNFDNEEADAYNVKQLKLEFQGRGGILIDAMEIVSYEPIAADVEKAFTPNPVVANSNSPFKRFKANQIYAGSAANTWGLEQTVCKNFQTKAAKNNPDYKVLDLSWNKASSGCDWIGLGFGWNNYEPKDLSSILETAAVEMTVRAPEGKTLYSVPIVALIEDYNGKQCASLFQSRYYSNPPILDKWQKVYIPLTDFDYEEIGVDMTNIKQMNYQVLGSGHLLIKEIKLVPFTPQPEKPKPVYAITDQLPVKLFDKTFVNKNAWGFIRDDCRDFSVRYDKSVGQAFLDLSTSKCDPQIFGISWNKWEPVDMTGLGKKEKLVFDISAQNLHDLKVGFENYSYQTNWFAISDDYVKPQNGSWVRVEIPMHLLLENEDFNKETVKQMLFSIPANTKAKLANIQMK